MSLPTATTTIRGPWSFLCSRSRRPARKSVTTRQHSDSESGGLASSCVRALGQERRASCFPARIAVNPVDRWCGEPSPGKRSACWVLKNFKQTGSNRSPALIRNGLVCRWRPGDTCSGLSSPIMASATTANSTSVASAAGPLVLWNCSPMKNRCPARRPRGLDHIRYPRRS
jgi:hypothetical protein